MRLLPHQGTRSEELETTALLIPEPENPHDSNAVAVQVGGTTVGYLPREVAPSYQPLLLRLRDHGSTARVPCRIWGGPFTDYDYDDDGDPVVTERFNASVRIGLADAHLCQPVNAAPDDAHVVLPDGGTIQVSGEEQHMQAILPLLVPEGECWAYATLGAMRESTGRGMRELVEVRLNGEPVGRLTPKMSGDLLPAIRHLEQLGLVTVVRARVKGNRLKAEVVLHCARAHELPSDWPSEVMKPMSPRDDGPALVSMGPPGTSTPTPHRPIPPKPTRIRFAVPPGWPPAPEGWEPSPGWVPDPTWPAAPSDWQFWVAE